MTAGGAGGPAGPAGPAPGDAAVGDSAAAPSWESLTGEDLVDAYRVTLGTRAAGVCVLAARDAGLDLAATITDVASASLRPPMLLASVHQDARLREALDEGATWVLSVLDGSADARAAARLLAEPGRPSLGQLTGISHHRLGGRDTPALLEAGAAWFECRTAWIRPAGDHDVVVGEVLRVRRGPVGGGALVHHLGRVRPL